MIRNDERDIDNIHFSDQNGIQKTISAVYYGGRKVWELIIGFLFGKDGYTLQSKEGDILKAKDQ